MSAGVVVSVTPTRRGDTLAADVSAADVLVFVEDSGDFAEDDDFVTGEQWLVIGDSVPMRYVGNDVDTGLLTLNEPVGAIYEAGTPVLLWDQTVQPTGAVSTEYIANVQLSDGSGSVPAVVPHELIPLAGVDNLNGAAVEIVESAPQQWTVSAVNGRVPVIDGTLVDLDDVDLPVPPLTDGLPPDESPAAIVLGGVGVLHVRWPAIVNADPVTYEVHVSTVDGFVPDGTTLAAETGATAITLRTLPNGSTLAYDTTYYVRLIAKDADPGAAAPGVQGSGQLYKVGNTEISALYAYFGDVSADQLTAGDIDAAVTVSGEVKTSTSGQRVVMDSQGLHLFDPTGSAIVDLPTDPAKRAEFKGNAEMRSLTVTESLTIQTAGQVAAGAGLELVGGTLAPSVAPTASLDHELLATPYTVTIPAPAAGTQAYVYNNWSPAFDSAGGNAFVLTEFTGGAATTLRISKHPIAGGAQTGSVTINDSADLSPIGLAFDTATSKLWVVLQDQATPYDYVLRRYSTALALEATHTVTPTDLFITPRGVSVVGTNLYIGAIHSTTRALTVCVIDLATFALTVQTGPVWSSSDQLNHGGFAAGTFDHPDGILRYVFTRKSTQSAHVYTAGAGFGERVNDLFECGSDGGIGWQGGIAWTGTEFRQLPFSTQHLATATTVALACKRYSQIIYTTQSATWWASYSWRNGSYLTDQGKRLSFTMKRRYRLRLTAATIPVGGANDPAAVTFFLGRNATDPGRTGMWQNGGTPANGVNTVALSTATFSGTNPPASNNFPGSTPGYIKSGTKRSDGTPKTNIDGLGAANVDGLIPPGSILMWAGATAPTGWALCDGATLNTATSPDLFAAIGYSYGGSGTSFNVPDLRSRFPIGAGTYKALAGNDGAAETARTPRHTHNATGLTTGAPLGGTVANRAGGGTADVAGPSHAHNVTGDTGLGDTNLMPHLSLNFIIKL